MLQNRDGERNLLKLFGLFSLLTLLFTSSLLAKSFEDFKRTQSSAFTHYKDKRDKEFSTYLRSSWREYVSAKPKKLYEKEKPKSIYKTVLKKIKRVGPLINIVLPKEEVVQKTISVQKNTKGIMFSFFGQYIGLNIDASVKSAKFYPRNQNGIISFFDVLAHSEYEDGVRDLQKRADDLCLNDWGRYLLVQKLSQEMYEKEDEQKLYTWFMLNKMGYDVKVGLSQKHIFLLHYSKKVIYNTPSYAFNTKKYYLLSAYAQKHLPRVYTYKQNYPEATKDLDLSLSVLPNFEEDIYKKKVSFKEFGIEYPLSYEYDKNLIDFMATYPQADYKTYFNAAFSEKTYSQIAKGMKKYLDDKKASEAINFVLHFVQNAFVYERDQQQFGREKVMFAYETLYYNKSDCEDRAILFSYLVHKLFKISVIGVKYKDHMATGLKIPMDGDSVESAHSRYLIADPTYINANIGESMPKYKFKVPQKFIYVKLDN